jgi:hypothetical protein
MVLLHHLNKLLFYYNFEQLATEIQLEHDMSMLWQIVSLLSMVHHFQEALDILPSEVIELKYDQN